MGLIAPMDAAFLIQEAREHPMHVGGLQLYHTPTGADEDYVGNLYQELLSYRHVAPLFSRQRWASSRSGNHAPSASCSRSTSAGAQVESAPWRQSAGW
jgi:hypothetical protein